MGADGPPPAPLAVLLCPGLPGRCLPVCLHFQMWVFSTCFLGKPASDPCGPHCPAVLNAPRCPYLGRTQPYSSTWKASVPSSRLTSRGFPSGASPRPRNPSMPPPHPCLLAHFWPQRATPVGGACPQRDDRPCGGPAGCPRPLCSRPKTEMTEGNRRCEDRTDRDSVCLGAGHRLTAGLELPPGLFAGASAVPLQENSHPLCPWSLPLRPERQGTWEQSLHR